MTKHCVSLEIAKQLKESGWKKETKFWWGKSTSTLVFRQCLPLARRTSYFLGAQEPARIQRILAQTIRQREI